MSSGPNTVQVLDPKPQPRLPKQSYTTATLGPQSGTSANSPPQPPFHQCPMCFLVSPTNAQTTRSPHLFKAIFPQQMRLAVMISNQIYENP